MPLSVKKYLREEGPKDVFVSYATSWEIAIKFSAGRLKLPETPKEFVRSRISRTGWLHLPIELEHVLDVATLPWFHRDPFDRLLISQARAESLSILTDDSAFKKYDVDCVSFADLAR